MGHLLVNSNSVILRKPNGETETDHISTNRWKEMELGQRVINILMDMNFRTERIHIHLLTIRQILIQNKECKHFPLEWLRCEKKQGGRQDGQCQAGVGEFCPVDCWFCVNSSSGWVTCPRPRPPALPLGGGSKDPSPRASSQEATTRGRFLLVRTAS